MDYVLVHGAFYGGWSWQPVADALRALGHDVHVVAQLPSGGADPARLGDLAADVAHVRALVDGVGREVVLTGHSYGGMVVAELADHPRVRHSVFLAAFRPKRGQTLLDIRSPHPVEWVESREDGTLHVTADESIAREVLAADLDEPVFAAVHGRGGAQAAVSYTRPSSGPEHTHPVIYVVCERDKAIFPADQEKMADGADHVVRLDAPHLVPLTHPREVAELLAGVR
ncbi:alpha/beta fold hydrolase [Amycolatopsis sp. FDAARGOS 1241]|uniref:alpha/beta fold hydrolase n=1 Tax=Amycolatopsis sp. FDAARGOS 1241 TaxID=2778070 RepID=UPI001950888F|nr:alpha/beta hydrolase [Amycolatopsis sp. FDAARGOS 1241]QRP48160.1 alpha/beta hydrolase [Amycolatopsis sp. FDAARGOS 1241]